VQGATRRTYEIREAMVGPSDKSVESLDLVLSALDTAAPEREEFDGLRERLREALTLFRESARRGRAGQRELNELGETLMDLARTVQADAHYQGEIRVLEERMRVVAESGRELLDRLIVRGESVTG
jgi:hypothetical protein